MISKPDAAVVKRKKTSNLWQFFGNLVSKMSDEVIRELEQAAQIVLVSFYVSNNVATYVKRNKSAKQKIRRMVKIRDTCGSIKIEIDIRGT